MAFEMRRARDEVFDLLLNKRNIGAERVRSQAKFDELHKLVTKYYAKPEKPDLFLLHQL